MLRASFDRIFNNKYLVGGTVGAAVVTGILYFAIIDAPLPVSYACENGEKFVLEVINRGQVKITSGSQYSIVLTRETKLDDLTTIYGDENNALTFVDGYGDQAIKTQRGDGPLSTICNPL